MLYSTKIKINGIEYILKIGLVQLIVIKKQYKINVMLQEDLSDLENILKLLHVSLSNYDDIPANFNKFVEWLDKSDASFEYIAKKVTEAVELGLHKKIKDKSNNVDEKTKNVDEETKNL
jgi:hypothetical protein